MQIVHLKKDPTISICNAEIFHEMDATEKNSLVTCLECLNIIHADYRFKGWWAMCNYYIEAFHKRKKIGEGTITRSKMMMPYIHDLWVLDDYRSKGLGARIVRSLLAKVNPPVTLKAIPYNHSDRWRVMDQDVLYRFYESLGFQKTGKGHQMVYCPIVQNENCVVEYGDEENIVNTKVWVKGYPELVCKGTSLNDALAKLVYCHSGVLGIRIEQEQKSKENGDA
jgi:GNAT superfamily N-acetyltransferase